MRIYLASQYRRREEMFGYLQELEALGHEVPARWVRGLHEDENRRQYTRAERAHFAREDLEDLRASDVAIFFTEEPYSRAGRGGRHVEFGYALALGLRLIVIGHLENVFHCLPAAWFVPDWDGAKRALVDPLILWGSTPAVADPPTTRPAARQWAAGREEERPMTANSLTRETGERMCVICTRPFLPHPANRHRQVICGPDCRAEYRRRAKGDRYAHPIPTRAGLVVCPCGEAFPREYDRLGRHTSRRLCPACRAVSMRDRDIAARPELPPDVAYCRECGCVLGTEYGGAEPAAGGVCEPCAEWQERAARKAATESHHSDSRAILAGQGGSKVETVVGAQDSAKQPLWTFGPYRALPAWEPPVWPRPAS